MDLIKKLAGYPMKELVPLIKEFIGEGKEVILTARGSSMRPMVKNVRDAIILSAFSGEVSVGDVILYERKSGGFVLHRVVKIGNTYTCIGDNQFVYEKDIKRDQIIAMVSSFWRDGREYSTTSVAYKVYCVLWHRSRFVRRLWRSLRYRLKKLCRKLFLKK